MLLYCLQAAYPCWFKVVFLNTWVVALVKHLIRYFVFTEHVFVIAFTDFLVAATSGDDPYLE